MSRSFWTQLPSLDFTETGNSNILAQPGEAGSSLVSRSKLASGNSEVFPIWAKLCTVSTAEHPWSVLQPSAPAHKLLSGFPPGLKRSLLLWESFLESGLLPPRVPSAVLETLWKKFASVPNRQIFNAFSSHLTYASSSLSCAWDTHFLLTVETREIYPITFSKRVI